MWYCSLIFCSLKKVIKFIFKLIIKFYVVCPFFLNFICNSESLNYFFRLFKCVYDMLKGKAELKDMKNELASLKWGILGIRTGVLGI